MKLYNQFNKLLMPFFNNINMNFMDLISSQVAKEECLVCNFKICGIKTRSLKNFICGDIQLKVYLDIAARATISMSLNKNFDVVINSNSLALK